MFASEDQVGPAGKSKIHEAGFAMGKAGDRMNALRKAKNKAIRCLHFIELYQNHTTYHDITVKFKSTTIRMKKQNKGCIGACTSSLGAGLLHFPLLNFMRFLSAHFSSLSRSLWMAVRPSGVSDTPPSFVSSANLLEGTLSPTIQIISEDVEHDWAQY
ncbi:hypothetical protein QYF61_027605 [Mycteria americana]|uniref:Uncharacterized protein n=1 Tax=Mycteria americana TaxID=33587 RepID=A0AAN7NG99_MYCAM|nr:hypothetical protein QYF61_027605 [Mycteria americana]